MSTMPPRTRTAAQKRADKANSVETPEFYEWDTFVEESHVDRPEFRMRVPVQPPRPDAKGNVPEVDPDADTHEFLVIPCPSGAAYINLVSAQQRGDVAGILVNLTTSKINREDGSELFTRLMELMAKADFPVVDKLAERVLMHYFNAPPKASDGSEGGAGESSAS